MQGAKWAHSVTARRQKNSGKNVKKRNGWQLVKKDSSIGLRWQDGEKKKPNTNREKGKKQKKQIETKLKLLLRSLWVQDRVKQNLQRRQIFS